VASFLTSAAPLIWIKSLAFEGQTVPVDAQPPTPGIFIHPYLRPPLSPLSVASFFVAAPAISPRDDYVCRHQGQARADAAGEVLVRRPLPVDVRADDGAEDDGLKQVHGRSLSLVQPKPLNQQKQNEEDRDWQQNPDYLQHIPPPSPFRTGSVGARAAARSAGVSSVIASARATDPTQKRKSPLRRRAGYLSGHDQRGKGPTRAISRWAAGSP